MIQPVVAAALVAALGGVVAIAARDGRVVALGLLVAMVAAPFASAPQPTALAVVFQILGSLLAAYLLLAAARSQSIESEGSGVGVLAEMALGAAAFSIGWFIVPVQPLTGPLAAQAAGVSLVAVAIVPLTGRDVLRVGVGVAVFVIGGSLLVQAWAGSESSVGQIVQTALLVAVAGATSLLISRADAPAVEPVTAAVAPDAAGSSVAELAAASGTEVPPDSTEEAASEPAAEAVTAPAGRGAAGRGRSGVASKKVAQATARPPATPPSSDAPPAPTRPSTIRNAPYRALRGESWLDPSRPPGGATPAKEAEEAEPETPQPPLEPFAPPGRVRRLRPREPRR